MAAVYRGHQGACQGMEKGDIGNIVEVEAEVCAVALEIEEEVGTGQACR